ncbi:hypothetical protein V7247_29955 [Priestia megaterium]|uniref:hypothetical protein n=1 Tax=Priestia megaterium TaxID=1404 RepID=UPI002FFE8DAE
MNLKKEMNILVVGTPKSRTTVISKNIQNSLACASYRLEPSHENFFILSTKKRK